MLVVVLLPLALLASIEAKMVQPTVPCRGAMSGFLCVPGMGDDVVILPTDKESAGLARKGLRDVGRLRSKREVTEFKSTGFELLDRVKRGLADILGVVKSFKELLTYSYESTIKQIIEDPTIKEIVFAGKFTDFTSEQFFRIYMTKLENINPNKRGEKKNFLDRLETVIDQSGEGSWLDKRVILQELGNCWYNLFGEAQDSKFKFVKGKPGYIRLFNFACVQDDDKVFFHLGSYIENFKLDPIREKVVTKTCKSNIFSSKCKESVSFMYFERGLSLKQRIEFTEYAKKKLGAAVQQEYKDKLPPALKGN